jgi:hypothetical protein
MLQAQPYQIALTKATKSQAICLQIPAQRMILGSHVVLAHLWIRLIPEFRMYLANKVLLLMKNESVLKW